MTNDDPFLDKIELSVRASNALRKLNPDMGYEDFMALTRKDVMGLRNAGVRTWREVSEVQDQFRNLSQQEDTHMERLCDLLGECNDLLMRNPDLRVIVNADASLTLARTGPQEARGLTRLRAALNRAT